MAKFKRRIFHFRKTSKPPKSRKLYTLKSSADGYTSARLSLCFTQIGFLLHVLTAKKRNLEIAGQSNFRTLQGAKSSQNLPSFTFICTFCMRKILQAARQNVLKNVIVQKGDTFSRKYSYLKTPRCVSRYTAWTPLIREYPAWVRSRKKKKLWKKISWHYNFKNFIERSC